MEGERKSPLTESENSVRDFVKKHVGSINILRGGWPDFIVRSTPHVAVEVKRGTDDLSIAQGKIAKLLLESGIRYYVIRVLHDGSFEIVELGGHGRVTEEEFVRAVEGTPVPSATERGAATRARVKSVLLKYARDQNVEPTLRKSKSDLAHESGVSLGTFNRHRSIVEREALLTAFGRKSIHRL